MTDKEFNKIERRSVILEQKADVLADKAQLLSTMMKDYLDNCFVDNRSINGNKLIGYANRIETLIQQHTEIQKELSKLENKLT